MDLQRAMAAHRAGHHAEARDACRTLLEARPDDPRARYLLGLSSLALGEADAAVAAFQRVIADQPQEHTTRAWLGAALEAAGRPDEALAEYRHLLSRQPGQLRVRQALVALLARLGRWAAIPEAVGDPPPRDPMLLHDLGRALHHLGRFADAVSCYRQVIAAGMQDPELQLNLAIALQLSGDTAAARIECERGLLLAPDHAPLRLRLEYLKALNWDQVGLDEGRGELEATIAAHLAEPAAPPLEPFSLNVLGVPAELHRDVVRERTKRARERAGSAMEPAPSQGDRLRIGYLSPDLRAHAVGQLVHGLFEAHDRERFQVHVYSLRSADDPYQRAVAAGAEHFLDASSMDDRALAQRIADDGVQVLVDLGGYTQGGRPEVLAGRPAPVIVHWLGYLNTLGGLVDHLLVDPVAAPPGCDSGFDESLVRLPRCFLPASPLPVTDGPAPTRSDLGLPDDGVVLACFNHLHKVTPATLDAWAEVLRAVPGSVLWMVLDPSDPAGGPVRAALADRGVADRVIAAARLPMDQHLARAPQADLVLDTWAYNGGATSVTALLSGVPVLSTDGGGLLGRMGNSLNRHLGLDELATADTRAYLERAIELAGDGDRLRALRAQLVASIDTLTDLKGFARDLESTYTQLWSERG